LQNNDPSAAVELLRRCVAAKPSFAPAHYNLGLAWGQTGDLEKATAEFRRAIELDRDFAPAHSRLGVALRRKGDLPGALVQFKEAVRLNPKNAEDHYNFGMALKGQGDLEAAIAEFRQAIALQPDFEKARYNLGIALRTQGQSRAAEAELRQGAALQDLKLRLARAKNLLVQGDSSLKAGNLDDALGFFQKALEESEDLPTTHYYLALTWEKKGTRPKQLQPIKRHWNSSPTMRKHMPAWDFFTGGKQIVPGPWKAFAKRL
jgi:tetratricopeptide (TPR) repeat protein